MAIQPLFVFIDEGRLVDLFRTRQVDFSVTIEELQLFNTLSNEWIRTSRGFAPLLLPTTFNVSS